MVDSDKVLVPREITEVQADMIGMPKQWFERAVSILSSNDSSVETFSSPTKTASDQKGFGIETSNILTDEKIDADTIIRVYTR